MPDRRTRAQLAIAQVLLAAPDDDHYGYGLLKATGFKMGTVVPALERFEEAGWLESRWDDDPASRGPRRRLYRLTEKGKAEAAAFVAQ